MQTLEKIFDQLKTVKNAFKDPLLVILKRIYNAHLILRGVFYGGCTVLIAVLFVIPTQTAETLFQSTFFIWLSHINLNALGIGILVTVMLLGYVSAKLLFRFNLTPKQITSIAKLIKKMAEDRVFPLQVEVNQDLPVSFNKAIKIPIDERLGVNIEETVHVEALIPIKAEIPIDTVVETPILNFGTVKLPIRATFPLELTVPIKAHVKVSAVKAKIHLQDNLNITLPDLVVPIKATLKTDIPLYLPD